MPAIRSRTPLPRAPQGYSGAAEVGVQRWLGVGVGGLALVVGLWNAWALSDVSARLAALEDEGPARERTAGARARSPRSRPREPGAPAARAEARADDAEGASALDLEDPAVQERLASAVQQQEDRRDAERTARFQESMHSELDAFAAEQGLDAATVAAVSTELDRRTEAFQSIRQDVHDGTISWLDARKEFDDLRTTSDETLRKLLGDERFEQLDTRLWGDREHRPWR